MGVGPASRDLNCQDYEYTTCRMEELEQYFQNYSKSDTTVQEKRVLGCYFMEGLNDFVSAHNIKHPLQDQILEILHKDLDIHQAELDYRVETDDPVEEHWWPIRKYVLKWRMNAKNVR
ncbi:hypothetical protein FLL45_13595 [Aliikangiella marina]|uniref:Uncharacterized protein n=1 Tax=Aliikangiella marina TaxID=1712262 RepID=A0A545T9J5_9GAMM|nr:hypothetical protein [Aliikangiella marina]TQV73893.1 hypothetical protein FLL45_13595 [Aliikangiella marina]